MTAKNKSGDEVFDLGLFLIKIQEDLQGYVLDLIRSSQVGDRQLIQLEKLIKKYFRGTVDSAISVLKEYNQFTVSERPQLVTKEEAKKG